MPNVRSVQSSIMRAAAKVVFAMFAACCLGGCMQMMVANAVTEDEQSVGQDLAGKAHAIEALYDASEHDPYAKGGSGQIIFDIGSGKPIDYANVYVFPKTKYGKAIPRPPVRSRGEWTGEMKDYIPEFFTRRLMHPDFQLLVHSGSVYKLKYTGAESGKVVFDRLAQSEYCVVIFAKDNGIWQGDIWVEQTVVPSPGSPIHIVVDQLKFSPAK